MKTVHCVVCAFFVFCLLDITTGKDFSEFWSSLPIDIGNAITDAWHSIIKAIKTPVKVRRLGRSRKMKTSTSSTSSTSSTVDPIEIISTLYHFPTDVQKFPTDVPKFPTDVRPTIPIISQPEWKSLRDWRILQRPNLVNLAREFSNRGSPSMYGRQINSYEGTTLKLSTTDEDYNFETYCTFHNFIMNMPQKVMEAFKQSWILIKDSFNNIHPTKKQYILEKYTIPRKDQESQRYKINIPVLPTPENRYEYLWRSKYLDQIVRDAYSTKKTVTRALSADETINQFTYTQLVTTTEEQGSLLKELKFGKYRLKIFYKLLFD